MDPRTSKKDYRSHQYSGPRKNRKRIQGQMKRYHGEVKSRNEVWCKKKKTDNANVPSTSQLKRLAETRSSVSDDPQDLQQNEVASSQIQSSQSKGLDICLQIKSSLQELRRQSSPVSEDSRPILELEVFPEKIKPVENNEFVDESQPIDEFEEYDDSTNYPEEDTDNEEKEAHASLLDERRLAHKRKIDILPQLRKKVKRNPPRKVVLKRQQEEAINAAQNAPYIEKIYLNTGYKVTKPETNNEAKVSPEIATSLDYKEQLYEFGKFVAEQLMAFDEKDAQSAQTEIKEVLTKYRLKCKIIKCLSKPGTSNGPTASAVEPKSNKATDTAISDVQPKPRPQGNVTKTSLVLLQPVSTASTRHPKTKVKSVKPSLTEYKTLRCDPKKIVKTYGRKLNVAKIPREKIQPTVLSHNTTAGESSILSRVLSVPACTKQISSTNTPTVSLVLVQSKHGGLRLTTARVDSDGTMLNFPNAPVVNVESLPPNALKVGAKTLDLKAVVTHPLMPQINLGTKTPQATISQVDSGTVATQTVKPQLNLQMVTQPISQVKPGTVVTQFISQENLGSVVTQSISQENLGSVVTQSISQENLGTVVTQCISQENPGTVVTQSISQENLGTVVSQTISQENLGTVVSQPISEVNHGTVVTQTNFQENLGTVVTQPISEVNLGTEASSFEANLGLNEDTPSLPHIKVDPLMLDLNSSQSDSMETVVFKCEPGSDDDDDDDDET